MIIDLFFYLTGFVFDAIGLLPKWQIWPQQVYDGIFYFTSILMKINFLFPIDTLLVCIVFFCKFFTYYLIFRIIMRFMAGVPIIGRIKL